jgi:hypothetical protein
VKVRSVDRRRFPVFDRFVGQHAEALVGFGGVTRLRLRELLLAFGEPLL